METNLKTTVLNVKKLPWRRRLVEITYMDEPEDCVNIDQTREQGSDNNLMKEINQGRKRRNVDKWKANVMKKKRRLGKEYKKKRVVYTEGRQLQNGCQNCRLKCHEKINRLTRQEILDSYWKLETNEEKWMFIGNNTKKFVKSRTTTGQMSSRRSSTLSYSFEVDNESINVCKKFFLANLHVSDKIV